MSGPRDRAGMAIVGVVLLGLAGCTGRPEPAAPVAVVSAAGVAVVESPEASGWPFGGRPVGSWSSAEYPGARVEVSVPSGRNLKLRSRCTGSGRILVRLRGRAFDDAGATVCNGRWRYQERIWPAQGSTDHGPFALTVERGDTVAAWAVQALELTVSSTPS